MCVDYPLAIGLSTDRKWIVSTGSTNYVYIWERQEYSDDKDNDVVNDDKKLAAKVKEPKQEKYVEESGWGTNNLMEYSNQTSSYIIDSDEDGKIEVSFRPGNYQPEVFNLSTLDASFDMASDDDEIVTNFNQTLPSSSFF